MEAGGWPKRIIRGDLDLTRHARAGDLLRCWIECDLDGCLPTGRNSVVADQRRCTPSGTLDAGNLKRLAAIVLENQRFLDLLCRPDLTEIVDVLRGH